MRSAARAIALAAAFAAAQVQATVFDDAYQCLKANAKLVYVTAEVGPKAVEFVVTQPQCVALVVSPAPVPTGVMGLTLTLTASGVLPVHNPACEGALYTTAAKPVAGILNEVGLLPQSVNQLIASNAANEAIGSAVQAIPGASVAFASFSCGCGLSDIGLNPPKIKEIYNAVKATGSKCTSVIANLMDGGSEALVSAVSNAGDALAGQSKHMDPQKYYQIVYKPRLMRDYQVYGNAWNQLEAALYKTTLPACEHYFDKHTMSATSANKTCLALLGQYTTEYAGKLPQLAEASAMAGLRAGTTHPSGFMSDKAEPAGKYCAAAAEQAVTPQNSSSPLPDRYKYLVACMADIGAFYGYEVKRDYAYSSTNRFLSKRVSDERWANRIRAAATKPGMVKKAAQIQAETHTQIMNEWKAGEAAKRTAWLAEIGLKNATAAEEKKKTDAAFDAQNKKNAAEAKAAAEKSAAKYLADAQAGCKDDRCKDETAAWIAACKPHGTEGQIMNGEIGCKNNLGVHAEISVKRADLKAKLDVQQKAVTVCTLDMDCSSGPARQRAEIEAAAAKVWDYGRDQALQRMFTNGARQAIVNEVAQMLAPVAARKLVAEAKPKALASEPPKVVTVPGKKLEPPAPKVVEMKPPEPPKGPAKVDPMPKKYDLPAPTVVAMPPKPIAMTPAPAATPNTYKVPPAFGSGAAGGSLGGSSSSFPKPGGVAGSLGTNSGTAIEGCSPRAGDPMTLMCNNDAALNRCRAFIVSGKVKSCVAK